MLMEFRHTKKNQISYLKCMVLLNHYIAQYNTTIMICQNVFLSEEQNRRVIVRNLGELHISITYKHPMAPTLFG